MGEAMSDETERQRQAWLEGEGYTVLRVTNDQVLYDLDAVLMYIASYPGEGGTPSP